MTKSALEARISDDHYRNAEEFERTSKQFMRALVPNRPPLLILDVGCGAGLNASFLTMAGHSVTGIDLSPIAIEKYRERGFEGILCDVESGRTPFADNSFDLVYVSEIIEHCADTTAFLSELNRLTKPGGKMLLSTPNSAFWPYRILGLFGRTASEYQHPGHVRFFSKRSLAAAITEAGFEIKALAARHMYIVLGSRIGEPLAPILQKIGFCREPRFATGGYFWQLSKFSSKASGFWADTLIVEAQKIRSAQSRAAAS
jgi:2-polyprenyl-3-methyl-5-hydroxy-6-metoxy-1,4-benzoquinol methylase